MYRRICLALLALGLLTPVAARAQSSNDLYLFGFFQGQYRYSSESGLTSPEEVSSFSLQQLNAFLMKDFSPSFSAFVNSELTNSFSTEQNWGALRLEEAWLRYNRSTKFNVKAGLLVPTFNNLNEVKNRTPLLPYVFRPFAYESSFSSIIDLDGFTPTQANLQAYGALSAGPLRFDYAAYVGNNSSDFASPDADGSVVAGTDLSMTKLVGSRVGVRWRSLKAGVSASHDQRRAAYDIVGLMNQSPAAIAQIGGAIGQPITAITPELLGVVGIPAELTLDDVGRTRLGVDLSFYRGSLFGEAEAIRVLHDLTEEHKATLALGGQLTNGFIRDNLDMTFYYAMLGYNVSEKVFGYAYYNYLQDNANSVQAAGLDFVSVGVGYRPIDGVVIKTQYVTGGTRENPVTEYHTHTFFGAVSVSF